MTEQTKVLYTGGDGDIGKVFARLANPKYKLRLTYYKEPFESDVHEVVQMDLTDFESVRAAMQGVDSVVHMGADSSSRAPWESILNNNIIGTYNVYEAARLEGVRRVVFASTNWTCAFHIVQHGKVGQSAPRPYMASVNVWERLWAATTMTPMVSALFACVLAVATTRQMWDQMPKNWFVCRRPILTMDRIKEMSGSNSGSVTAI